METNIDFTEVQLLNLSSVMSSLADTIPDKFDFPEDSLQFKLLQIRKQDDILVLGLQELQNKYGTELFPKYLIDITLKIDNSVPDVPYWFFVQEVIYQFSPDIVKYFPDGVNVDEVYELLTIHQEIENIIEALYQKDFFKNYKPIEQMIVEENEQIIDKVAEEKVEKSKPKTTIYIKTLTGKTITLDI